MPHMTDLSLIQIQEAELKSQEDDSKHEKVDSRLQEKYFNPHEETIKDSEVVLEDNSVDSEEATNLQENPALTVVLVQTKWQIAESRKEMEQTKEVVSQMQISHKLIKRNQFNQLNHYLNQSWDNFPMATQRLNRLTLRPSDL